MALEAQGEFDRVWMGFETGPVPLTLKQITALAGEMYHIIRAVLEDDPGEAAQWAQRRRNRLDADQWRASSRVPHLLIPTPLLEERFGEPIGDSGVASVLAGSTTCWHSECREETEIVTGIHFEVGTVARVLTLAQFDEFPELFEQIRPHIPRNGRVGAVKRRYSHTRQEEYLSNGCFACDRLMGRHYDHDATEDGEIVAEIPVLLIDRWRTLIDIAACTSHWRIVPESDAELTV